MALGGGSFLVQNKELPGAYINFVSKSAATAALSERGVATMPLELDWGKEGEIFEVTNEDFQKNSMEIFGYEYTSDKLERASGFVPEYTDLLWVSPERRREEGK